MTKAEYEVTKRWCHVRCLKPMEECKNCSILKHYTEIFGKTEKKKSNIDLHKIKNKLMKFTVDDIKNINSELLNIKVHCNKGIVLDPFLINNLVDYKPRKKYDFEIYLPKYGVYLQRPYVWEEYQQSEYIVSILQEKPLDNIIAIQHEDDKGNTTMQIIDGKQRLTTIQKFLLGEIPVTINKKKVWWDDFDIDAKLHFRSRLLGITGVVYYTYEDDNLSDDDKIRLFNFYNFSGTPQTEEHKNRLKELLKQE